MVVSCGRKGKRCAQFLVTKSRKVTDREPCALLQREVGLERSFQQTVRVTLQNGHARLHLPAACRSTSISFPRELINAPSFNLQLHTIEFYEIIYIPTTILQMSHSCSSQETCSGSHSPEGGLRMRTEFYTLPDISRAPSSAGTLCLYLELGYRRPALDFLRPAELIR